MHAACYRKSFAKCRSCGQRNQQQCVRDGEIGVNSSIGLNWIIDLDSTSQSLHILD